MMGPGGHPGAWCSTTGAMGRVGAKHRGAPRDGTRSYPAAPSDPCQNNPCLHGGTCRANGSVCSCSCAQGFTGENCEIGERAVSPVPCPCCLWGLRGQGGRRGSWCAQSPPLPPQTSTTACRAPARMAAPASTRSTPSSASACPATGAAAARKVGNERHGAAPSSHPRGQHRWPNPAPAPMGTQEPLPLQWGAPPCTPGCWGLAPVPGVPMSPQTRRAASTTGTSSRATATATSPAGAPGRTRSGTAAAAPGTSPASTRRRSTASSTVRGSGARTGDRGGPPGTGLTPSQCSALPAMLGLLAAFLVWVISMLR